MQKSEYSLWNKVCNLSKVKKKHWNDLIDFKKDIRNIDLTLVSLLLTLKKLHTFS